MRTKSANKAWLTFLKFEALLQEQQETGVYARSVTESDWVGIWELDNFDEVDDTSLSPGQATQSINHSSSQ